MHRGNLSRRGFLQRSLVALGAAGLPVWYAREVLAADEAKKNTKPAANDRFIMGAIGIGSPQSRGRAIAGDALGTLMGVQFVAVCDVDKRHRERAAKEFQEKGMDVEQYHDFRQLLDRKDIEAVNIATPDHWHALIAIDALRKGKDVYCEKPSTLTIGEGKVLVEVAKQTGRIFQVGSQQRSDPRFRLACELVRNGRLGKIKTVETWIGGNPKGGPFRASQPPPELNWDFWQGQTPKVDYIRERCHYQFRWWYEYSGGKMTDWGAHHNDIAQWALGMDGSGPVAVEAEGEPPSTGPHSYNCHPTFKVTCTYANGAKLVCTSKENGVRFEGEDGKWIFVSRSKIEASDPKLLEEPLPADAVRLYVSNHHMGNFLEGVRTRKPTVCPAEVGHRSVSVCHLGVIALRSGKKLKWDPAQEVFLGDDEANKWLSRPTRAPWKLEA